MWSYYDNPVYNDNYMFYSTVVLVIGFTNTSYFVHEDSGNVTLTVHVSGGMTQCNGSEWTVYFNLTAQSAQSMLLNR